jgi:hypothetical protein
VGQVQDGLPAEIVVGPPKLLPIVLRGVIPALADPRLKFSVPSLGQTAGHPRDPGKKLLTVHCAVYRREMQNVVPTSWRLALDKLLRFYPKMLASRKNKQSMN